LHACARLTSRMMCWGTEVPIGDGASEFAADPTEVVGNIAWSGVMAVGGASTCGKSTTGDTYCWGSNVFGQLGDGTFTKRLSPTRVPIDGAVSQVSKGPDGGHACAVTVSGRLWCWGWNNLGQLGMAGGNSNVPVEVLSWPSMPD